MPGRYRSSCYRQQKQRQISSYHGISTLTGNLWHAR